MPADRLPDPILCEADAQLAEDRRSVFQRALDDSLTLSPAEFDDKWRVPFGQKETVTLAVASARRWARRTDLSPELRLRRIWQVLTTALEEAK